MRLMPKENKNETLVPAGIEYRMRGQFLLMTSNQKMQNKNENKPFTLSPLSHHRALCRLLATLGPHQINENRTTFT